VTQLKEALLEHKNNNADIWRHPRYASNYDPEFIEQYPEVTKNPTQKYSIPWLQPKPIDPEELRQYEAERRFGEAMQQEQERRLVDSFNSIFTQTIRDLKETKDKPTPKVAKPEQHQVDIQGVNSERNIEI